MLLLLITFFLKKSNTKKIKVFRVPMARGDFGCLRVISSYPQHPFFVICFPSHFVPFFSPCYYVFFLILVFFCFHYSVFLFFFSIFLSISFHFAVFSTLFFFFRVPTISPISAEISAISSLS